MQRLIQWSTGCFDLYIFINPVILRTFCLCLCVCDVCVCMVNCFTYASHTELHWIHSHTSTCRGSTSHRSSREGYLSVRQAVVLLRWHFKDNTHTQTDGHSHIASFHSRGLCSRVDRCRRSCHIGRCGSRGIPQDISSHLHACGEHISS